MGAKDAYVRFATKLEKIAFKEKKALEKGFYNWGLLVGTYPAYFVLGTLIFALLCALGLLNAYQESRPEKLWVSKHSEFLKEKTFYDHNYGGFYRLNLVIATPKTGNDIIQADMIAELWDFHQGLQNLTTTYEDKTLTFQDVCAHVYDNSPCLMTTVLDYWASKADIYTDSALHQTVSQTLKRAPYGNFIDPTTIIGDREYLLYIITRGGAFMNTYLLNNSQEGIDMASKSAAWESVFIDYTLAFNKTTQHISLFFQAERSIQDILAEKIAADSKFIILSYVLMFLYTIVSVGRLDTVESKIMVGFCAVALEVLAILISLGILSAGNVSLSPLTLQVIPFLILGNGINDVFVLTSVFVTTPLDPSLTSNPAQAQRKALAQSLRSIGPSMLYTYTTNVSVFLVGAATNMPAVRDFCFQTALAMFMSLALLLTLYSALLVLDGRRIQANRYDVLFCFVRSKVTRKLNEKPKTADGSSIEKKDILRYLLYNYYLPFLRLKPVKAVVIIIFVALAGVGIGGATQIEKGLGVTDVVPSNSYVAHFFEMQSKYFANLGAPVYIITKEFDYTDWNQQDEIEALYLGMQADKWLVQPFVSWYYAFNFWLPGFGGKSNETIGGRIPPHKFYPWLHEFLNDEVFGRYFTYDIIFDKTTGNITTTRMLGYSVGLNTTADYIGSIQKTQNLATNSPLPDCFAYSVFYIYFEQYLFIDMETVQGLLTAAAVIFVSSSLYLMHLGAATIILVIVAMIEANIIGMMYYWTIDLNAISSVNLIMGLGIAVEFNSYIILCFMTSNKPTAQERIDDSMMQVGISVVNGAISTIIGVFLLAFAEYNLFRTYYFKMYFSIVIFGATYGLIFLPVVLSLIGPSYVSELMKTSDNIEMQEDLHPKEIKEVHEEDEIED